MGMCVGVGVGGGGGGTDLGQGASGHQKSVGSHRRVAAGFS